MPEKVLVNIYYSLVYPYLTYCGVVWGFAGTSHTKRLTILQKRIIRIITKQDPWAHTEALFSRTKILRVEDIHKYLTAIYIYKNPSKYSNNLTAHQYSTRHVFLRAEFRRPNSIQRSMNHVGPRIWNSLPAELRSIQSLAIFKKTLKKYYLERALGVDKWPRSKMKYSRGIKWDEWNNHDILIVKWVFVLIFKWKFYNYMFMFIFI